MSKNKTNTTNTTNTPNTNEPPVEGEVELSPAEASTALVIAAGSEVTLAPAVVEASWFDEVPKPIRALFAVMPPAGEGELAAMVEQLPEADRENFAALVEALNPIREGMASSREDFKIPEARIYHGVGDDTNRSAAAPVGSVYTGDGQVLVAWDKAQARTLKIEQSFQAAIVGIQETRSWWKPRDKSFILDADINPDSKAPICVSMDRVRGSRYGACAACSHRPYANGSYDPNSCGNDAHVYIVLRGFKGIYEITLKGASLKLAVQPIQRIKGKLWDVWFDLGLAEQRNDQGRWFALTATPHTTDAHPQGEPTSQAERGVLRVLARTVLNESYFNAMKSIYTSRHAPTAAASEAGADMAALKARAALGEATPDYSKNNL